MFSLIIVHLINLTLIKFFLCTFQNSKIKKQMSKWCVFTTLVYLKFHPLLFPDYSYLSMWNTFSFLNFLWPASIQIGLFFKKIINIILGWKLSRALKHLMRSRLLAILSTPSQFSPSPRMLLSTLLQQCTFLRNGSIYLTRSRELSLFVRPGQ